MVRARDVVQTGDREYANHLLQSDCVLCEKDMKPGEQHYPKITAAPHTEDSCQSQPPKYKRVSEHIRIAFIACPLPFPYRPDITAPVDWACTVKHQLTYLFLFLDRWQ